LAGWTESLAEVDLGVFLPVLEAAIILLLSSSKVDRLIDLGRRFAPGRFFVCNPLVYDLNFANNGAYFFLEGKLIFLISEKVLVWLLFVSGLRERVGILQHRHMI